MQFAGGTTWTNADIRAIYLDQHATSANDVIHGFIETADNDEVYGYSGNDVTSGNDGNDTLFCQEGADTLIGGAGDDFLMGGAGADVFVFASSTEGTDRIDDFTVGNDRIELSGIVGFDDFADVLAIAEEWGGTTWLNFDQSNSIRLQNIALNTLTAQSAPASCCRGPAGAWRCSVEPLVKFSLGLDASAYGIDNSAPRAWFVFMRPEFASPVSCRSADRPCL